MQAAFYCDRKLVGQAAFACAGDPGATTSDVFNIYELEPGVIRTINGSNFRVLNHVFDRRGGVWVVEVEPVTP